MYTWSVFGACEYNYCLLPLVYRNVLVPLTYAGMVFFGYVGMLINPLVVPSL